MICSPGSTGNLMWCLKRSDCGMHVINSTFSVLMLILGGISCTSSPVERQTSDNPANEPRLTHRFEVTPVEADNRIDITIDGDLFTSYLYPSSIMKPVLFPLVAADGTEVTRGFPVSPKPGERMDHRHHVGFWFNYGEVNELDFWGHSEATDPGESARYGTIDHIETVETISGDKRGVLRVKMRWNNSKGKTLIEENTTFIFRANENLRFIDRITTLTAVDEIVHFNDSKEGALAIRVARFLEQPSDKPEILTDANGNPTDVPLVDNEGVRGLYFSSEGLEGDDVWGTRAKWVQLAAEKDGVPYSVVIMDHQDNPGHPTFWHARGYGLFAANPFGQKVFSEGKLEMNFRLQPGEPITFRHRVMIASDEVLNMEQLDSHYQQFITQAGSI